MNRDVAEVCVVIWKLLPKRRLLTQSMYVLVQYLCMFSICACPVSRCRVCSSRRLLLVCTTE